MQRLFSIFPHGWPGAGIALLRLCTCLPLLLQVNGNPTAAGWVALPALLGASSVLVGLLTPIGAALVIVARVWLMLSTRSVSSDHLIGVGLALCLLMLGPGGWSIDARLYGRKVIEI